MGGKSDAPGFVRRRLNGRGPASTSSLRPTPLGRSTTFTYDGLNSPTSITDPTGVSTTMAYDSSANLLSTSRPLLDAVGATVAVATTTFNYGEGPGALPGDVASIVDATGATWSYAYDAFANLVSSTDPLGHRASATLRPGRAPDLGHQKLP